MEHITSRQNPLYKQARKLAGSARERHKTGQIVMDGTRLIGAYAEQFGLKNCTLLVSSQDAQRPDIQQIVEADSAQHAYLLADALFADIAQVATSEGIVAIAATPTVASKTPDDFRVLLEGIQDPGNLGGLLRTAAAAGATSADLTRGCADAWSPKSLRGGMGAQFVLRVREHTSLAASLADFQGTVIGTSARAEQTIYDIDLSGPVMMMFGNEGRGLPDEVLSLAHQLVHIPMAGRMESLNVAAAAAICCFEKLRQTRVPRR
ncbi:MAG: TrmH family RNA methyltransferase [Burkholderiales bacterium]